MDGDETFPHAGMGAAAGGHEAFGEFLRKLPPKLKVAMVLVQHLDPLQARELSELLARHTALPIRDVERAMPLEPGHVYVIPPNQQPSISGGILKLSPRRASGLPPLPMDFLLPALALLLKSDGESRMIDFIKIPLAHPDGQPRGLVVLGRDVTERPQTESGSREAMLKLTAANEALEKRVAERTVELERANEALRASEARLQAIMNNSPSMIFLKDAQGRYLHFNQRFAREFDLRLEDTVGKTDLEIFPASQAAIFRANDVAVMEARAPVAFDEVALHADGPHTSIVTKFPLFDEKGAVQAVGGIVTDITDRKRLEAEILRISEREQRRIAQDLHDGLGQELTGAWCLCEGLRKDLESESSAAAEGAARLSKLLKSAVAHTRSLARGLHPVAAEPDGLMVALRELAERAEALFRVECEFKCEPPVRLADERVATHLYRIAQEAVTNAIKHGRAKRIEIALTATPELMMLAVSDDGVGFLEVARGPGLGMQIMTHRAGLVGGTLLVQHREAGGVKIVCVLENAAKKKAGKLNDKKKPKTERPG